MPRSAEQEARFSNPDNDPRGDWISVDYTSNKTAEQRPALYYPVVNPNTGEEIWPPRQTVWRFEKSTHERNVRENRVWRASDGKGFPRLKRFRTEVQAGVVPSTWWTRQEAGDNQESKRELRSIFGDLAEQGFDFETPKPSRLIKRLISIAVAGFEESIILDSFGGSGTTAHAVLALNAEDGGARQFILVEQEDYADSLTAERVRRVIRGAPGAKDAALRDGLGGTFSYVELGEPYDEARLLSGDSLPSYADLARYTFFTATGEQWDASQLDRARYYLGESSRYQVYLLYEPDLDRLKNMPLNLSFVKDVLGEAFARGRDKPRLVIAPLKYLDDETMTQYGVEYCQLPFGIYKFKA